MAGDQKGANRETAQVQKPDDRFFQYSFFHANLDLGGLLTVLADEMPSP